MFLAVIHMLIYQKMKEQNFSPSQEKVFLWVMESQSRGIDFTVRIEQECFTVEMFCSMKNEVKLIQSQLMKNTSGMSNWKLLIIMWIKLSVMIVKVMHPKRQLSLSLGNHKEKGEPRIFMEAEQMLLTVN